MSDLPMLGGRGSEVVLVFASTLFFLNMLRNIRRICGV